jgi:hypothetical protein
MIYSATNKRGLPSNVDFMAMIMMFLRKLLVYGLMFIRYTEHKLTHRF